MEALATGAARDVALLIGHGRDEYSLLAAKLPDIDDGNVDPLIDQLTPTPGARRYRDAFPMLPANNLRETAMSDWLFRMPALHLAEAADRGGGRVWFYELRWGYGPQGALTPSTLCSCSAPPTSTARSPPQAPPQAPSAGSWRR